MTHHLTDMRSSHSPAQALAITPAASTGAAPLLRLTWRRTAPLLRAHLREDVDATGRPELSRFSPEASFRRRARLTADCIGTATPSVVPKAAIRAIAMREKHAPGGECSL